MKFIHTSDWHLGQRLMNMERIHEHEHFLDFLHDHIIKNNINALLVSGDIFDTATPPNSALSIYYKFLTKLAGTDCNNIIITGGNHDSISSLNAPREVLKQLNVHVIGGAEENISDEIIILKDKNEDPLGIVCAIPFLRDRDLRKHIAGESMEEKSEAFRNGLKSHYKIAAEIALELRNNLNEEFQNIPLIAMGHLAVTGTVSSDSEREIHIGNLINVSVDLFSEELDYIALGHLHKQQKVNELNHIRYSGSPLAFSFNETDYSKIFLEIEIENSELRIKEIEIPVIQKLIQLKGNFSEITESLNDLKDKNAWLEIIITEWEPGLFALINSQVEESELKILAIKNEKSVKRNLSQKHVKQENLEELKPEEVFEKLLEIKKTDDAEKKELIISFKEILNSVYEENS